MCQGWSNARQAAPAPAAPDVVLVGVPVVGKLVDEAEPLPFGDRRNRCRSRGGNRPACHRCRRRRMRKRVSDVRCPASRRACPACTGCQRIGAVEFGRHRAIDIGRQSRDERIVGASGQENIVAFLDPRHVDGGFCRDRGQDDDDRGRPSDCRCDVTRETASTIAAISSRK